MPRPLRRESSRCNGPRRVVGGEPLCLAKAFVSMTGITEKESKRRDEALTGLDLLHDCLDLLPCGV